MNNTDILLKELERTFTLYNKSTAIGGNQSVLTGLLVRENQPYGKFVFKIKNKQKFSFHFYTGNSTLIFGKEDLTFQEVIKVVRNICCISEIGVLG